MELATEKNAFRIVLLDVRHLTPIADYFVILSVDNERQMQAVQEALRKELPVRPMGPRQSAAESGGWLLLDYGSVIVHIFRPEVRARYNLEGLWSEARTVVQVQ